MNAVMRNVIRCAIYTRKSVDQGLDQEFNTLDAQRASCEAYIKAKEYEGWQLVPDHYDDGGFSGKDTNRPGFQKLLTDVRSGYVNMVVCYKIDRLSRRLSDFVEIFKILEANQASFCCVTQEFNSSTSMGRMAMNMLMTFAQFERELDSERIRDKIAQSKRKGLWLGGITPYGYLKENKRLIPDPATKDDVKRIFETFLEQGTQKKTCRKLTQLGLYRFPDKQVKWNTVSLTRCLRNCAYIGKVKLGDELLPGQQMPIIDSALWNRVQARLDELSRMPKDYRVDSSQGVLLRGIVRCGTCGSLMGSRWTRKVETGAKYWYYVDVRDSKRGESSCPVKSVASGVLEPAVEREVMRFLRTPTMIGLIADEMHCMTYQVERELEDETSFWSRIGPIAQRRVVQLVVASVTVYENSVNVRLKTGGCEKLIREVKNGYCDGN